jgi:hypothetical protein
LSHDPRITQRAESVRLGLIIATATWVWVALIDLIFGDAFRTFEALGGIIQFTVVHYALNLLLGTVLVAAVRGSDRAPSLSIALTFGLVMFQVAFAMITPLLAEFGLGNMAWVAIFGGSLVGTAIALAVLSRNHPLGEHLHRAEAER